MLQHKFAINAKDVPPTLPSPDCRGIPGMKNIHLVHVGKCAGESVMSALKTHSVPFKNYHVGQTNIAIANQVLACNEDDLFIVLMRDPIARFISAFEWDLLEKVIARNQPPALEIWRLIFDTFPSANSLAEALTSPQEELRRVAETAMKASALHMQMDLGWYLPPHIASHLHRGNTAVVRIEHINEDFQRLINEIGVEIEPEFIVPLSKNNYKSRLPEHRRTEKLSEVALSNVRFYSLTSYETMKILQEKGIVR